MEFRRPIREEYLGIRWCIVISQGAFLDMYTSTPLKSYLTSHMNIYTLSRALRNEDGGSSKRGVIADSKRNGTHQWNQLLLYLTLFKVNREIPVVLMTCIMTQMNLHGNNTLSINSRPSRTTYPPSLFKLLLPTSLHPPSIRTSNM